jgi:hypothetical protein
MVKQPEATRQKIASSAEAASRLTLALETPALTIRFSGTAQSLDEGGQATSPAKPEMYGTFTP